MFIKSVRINKSYIIFTVVCFIIISSILLVSIIYPFSLPANSSELTWENTISDETTKKEEKKYIKWVDFSVTYDVLNKTSSLDINSHNNNEPVKFNWIELLSYLACKYGGNFKRFSNKDLTELTNKLKDGYTMEELTKDLKNYSYYYEAYDAILHEFIGEYEIETPIENETTETTYKKKYGVKAFLPIAKNYSFNHYDDFGNARSYGFKRVHLGNDLMGSIGTPIIAVESGIIEALRLESIWRLANWN